MFWKIVDTLESDSAQAQIVVGLVQEGSKKDRLVHLGERITQEIFRCMQSNEEVEAVMVMSTDSRSCQDAVARLGEMGVKQLHAIYPKPGGARRPAGPDPDRSQQG